MDSLKKAEFISILYKHGYVLGRNGLRKAAVSVNELKEHAQAGVVPAAVGAGAGGLAGLGIGAHTLAKQDIPIEGAATIAEKARAAAKLPQLQQAAEVAKLNKKLVSLAKKMQVQYPAGSLKRLWRVLEHLGPAKSVKGLLAPAFAGATLLGLPMGAGASILAYLKKKWQREALEQADALA